MASIAVGALGAGLGFLAGGPAGARLGWAVGTVVGGLLFPPRNDSQVGKLDNLHINLSSQGAAIPRIWGAQRLGANIIWNTDLVEKKSSHKGGPSTFRYYANAAAYVCAGPIAAITKIYANDLLIYDSSRTPSTKYTIRIYLGTETQMPDALIEAHQGLGTTPAYRGTAYVVFENFDVTDFGNALPNFSFEVQQNTSATVGNILTDIAQQMGLSSSQVDFSLATQAILGYQVNTRTTGASAIDPLLHAYAGDLFESDGKLRYVPRGQAAVAIVALNELGAALDNAQVSRVEIRRAEELTLPSVVDVVYQSPARQYQQETQHASRMTKPHVTDALTVNYPGALSDDQGIQLAHRTLYDAWLAREQYRYFLPPKYMYVTPGDVLIIPTDTGPRRLRCNDVELALPGAVAITGVLDSAPVITQIAAGGSTPPAFSTVNLAPVPTTFVVFSADAAGNAIELQKPDGFYAGFYVSAGGPPGWQGATVYYSADGGTTYIEAGSVTEAAAVGVTSSALATFTGANPDTTNSVGVALVCGALEPSTQSEVNAGLNQALIGNEVVGYTGALLGTGSAYTLSGLTRSEVGTLPSGHASGERFCTLPAATRITVPDSLEGHTLQVKCVSPYQTLTDVVAQNVVIGTKSGGPVAASSGGGAVAGTGPTTPIAAMGAAGTSASFAPFDHTHQGVHSVGVFGASSSVGDVKLHAGANISLTAVSDGVQIDASSSGGGSGSATWTLSSIYDSSGSGTVLAMPVGGFSIPTPTAPIVYLINVPANTNWIFKLPVATAQYPIAIKLVNAPSAGYSVQIQPHLQDGSTHIETALNVSLTNQFAGGAFLPDGTDWWRIWQVTGNATVSMGTGVITEYVVFVSGGSSSPFSMPQIMVGGTLVPYMIVLKNKYSTAATLNAHSGDLFENGTATDTLAGFASATYLATQTFAGGQWDKY